MTERALKGDGQRTLRLAEPGDWVGVVANAASGRGRGRVLVERLVGALEQSGLGARVAWSLEGRRDLVEQSSGDDGCRCLVAVGGDGTISALLNEGPSVPIAVIPAGTENLFAAHFRFRRDPEALAEAILLGRVAPLDLGESDGRRFALMAGVGFDAAVVSTHHEQRVGRSGHMKPTNRAAYVDPVLRTSVGYRFPELKVTIPLADGQEVLKGTTVFVFNLPRYALGLPFAPAADGDDGLLDVVVFRDGGALQALRYLWLVFRGLHLKRPGVYHRHVRKLAIESDRTVPVQLDGDPGGVLEAGVPRWVGVNRRAVEVLIPPVHRVISGVDRPANLRETHARS